MARLAFGKQFVHFVCFERVHVPRDVFDFLADLRETHREPMTAHTFTARALMVLHEQGVLLAQRPDQVAVQSIIGMHSAGADDPLGGRKLARIRFRVNGYTRLNCATA